MMTLSISDPSASPRRRSPKFLPVIIALIDAFREALAMRRAADKTHPFPDG